MRETLIPYQGGKLHVEASEDRFPLGHRGQLPVSFFTKDLAGVRIAQIPGVVISPGRIKCTWDAGLEVVALLSESAETVFHAELQRRLTCPIPLPGLERARTLGLTTKRHDYQAEDVAFLLRRSYAVLGEPPRAGKSLIALMISVLADCKKTLIICNALGKYVWAEQVKLWTGEDALLLEGRSGKVGRIDGKKVRADIASAKFVICNYDILAGHRQKTKRGALTCREDLPGWAPMLLRHKFDMAVLDESHRIKGWKPGASKQTRQQITRAVVAPIPRVYGVTGTFLSGEVADAWGQLDCVSDGLWS